MMRTVIGALVLLCMAAPAVAARPAEKTFEQVFSAKGEPAATHFKAIFAVNGAEHNLEVWRETNRIRRVTDGTVETFARRKSGTADYRLSVLDFKKKIRTDIDRENLYRIGHFSDWFDLGHGLRHPKGQYHLSATSAPARTEDMIAPCAWFDLAQEGRITHVCWSIKHRLPLLIQAADGRTLWRITSVDHALIRSATFAIHDEGFVRNDANRDIEQD